MMLEQIVNYFSLLLNVVGMIVIVVSAFVAIIIVMKILLVKMEEKFFQYEKIKGDFTQKLVFGLDFFIAGDALHTIIIPSLEELTRLAVIEP